MLSRRQCISGGLALATLGGIRYVMPQLVPEYGLLLDETVYLSSDNGTMAEVQARYWQFESGRTMALYQEPSVDFCLYSNVLQAREITEDGVYSITFRDNNRNYRINNAADSKKTAELCKTENHCTFVLEEWDETVLYHTLLERLGFPKDILYGL